MSDILFKSEDYIFSYRVGGILIHNNKILLQKVKGDDGYAFIGGHVSFGETTDETLVREFKEEINANVKIERLVMVCENFFRWGKLPCQQINFYYLISLKDKTEIPLEGVFSAVDELGNERVDIDMCWVPVSDLADIKLYPEEAKTYIMSIPDEIVYFSHKEEN